MPTRQAYRPGYAARRFIHHKRVDFAVWLQNRKVDTAFYDPYIDGSTPSRLSIWMGHRAAPWIIGGIAVLSAVTAVILALHSRFGSVIPLADVPAQTQQISQQVAPPVSAPPASVAPKPAAAPEPSPPASAPAPEPPVAVASLTAQPSTETPSAWNLPETYNALVACKMDRTLYVYHHEAKQWKKVAAFNMAFGRKSGDKADAGDLRTPEGRYWITAMYAGPQKGPLYGSLVFTLNYPTPVDQADGKSGQGIWIHGVEEGKHPTYTHGCLSLANDDVLALSQYADIGTPVLILPDSLSPDPAKQMDEAGMKSEYPALMTTFARRNREDTLAREKALKWARTFVDKEAKDYPQLADESLLPAERQAVLASLSKWRADWCSRDVAHYGEHYAADFRDKDGRDRKAFLERKGKIFETKNRIGMDMGNPQMELEGYGRVKVTFRQEYVAEGSDGVQRSSSMKTMRLEAGPQGWLIVNE